MPLAHFFCPDGKLIETSECLTQCRMPSRCLTRTTLQVIARDRQWDGVPHVTSLLNGIQQYYLTITKPYPINPKEQAFALLGSNHHKLMEGTDQGWSEIQLNNGWMQGTADLLEQQGEELVLTDFKTFGSFRVVRVLGLAKVGGVFKVANLPDMEQETLQLNAYRLMLQTVMGLTVNRMQLQITVRDGGLAIAKQRGVTDLMYLVPVPILSDEYVTDYFQVRADQLHKALASGSPPPCSWDETWQGTRCRSYCPVVSHCVQGKAVVRG